MSDADALNEAARTFAKAAQKISSAFSTRIPAATHVVPSVDQGRTASVITEGQLAPNAAPFEAAEAHPLWADIGSWRYDHDKWGRQPLRPYMLEAAETAAQDACYDYSESVIDYMAKTGWK